MIHAQTHHPPCVSRSPDAPIIGPAIPAGQEPGEGLEGQRTTGANALFCFTAVIMLAGEKEKIPGEAAAERWDDAPFPVLLGGWGRDGGDEEGTAASEKK